MPQAIPASGIYKLSRTQVPHASLILSSVLAFLSSEVSTMQSNREASMVSFEYLSQHLTYLSWWEVSQHLAHGTEDSHISTCQVKTE